LGIGTHSRIEVAGLAFEVETETRVAGHPMHPIIDTTVYLHGRVMYRRVKTYQDRAAAAAPETEDLRKQLESQHDSVVGDLRTGVLKFEVPGLGPKPHSPAAPIEFPKGIEIVLLNADSWLAAGTASLNIEVRGRATTKPAAGVTIEVTLEGAEPPLRFQAGVDPRGRVSLTFPMPRLGAVGGALVIRASGAAGQDEVRYRVKPRVQVPRKAQMP
jgi:hypothetical protein